MTLITDQAEKIDKNYALIIGGGGFIGSALAKRMHSDGYVIFTTSSGYKKNGVKCDYDLDYTVENFTKLLKIKNFDQVIYLSGNPSPSNSEHNAYYDIERTNIPLLNLLVAMKNQSFRGKLWFASSVAVYGGSIDSLLSPSSSCSPLSFYAASKMLGEHHVKIFNRNYGIKTGSLRIFSTYGPGLQRQLVYDIYKKIMQSKGCIELIGTGDEARDLSYIDDQVNAIMCVIQNEVADGRAVNIGAGYSVKTRDIANVLIKILKPETKLVFANSIRTYDGTSWVADVSELKKLGHFHRYGIQAGIEATVKSYSNTKA